LRVAPGLQGDPAMNRLSSTLFLSLLVACGTPPGEGEEEDLFIDPETDPDLVPIDDGKADGVSRIPSAVVTAAQKNLKRVLKDLDGMHLKSYRYTGTDDVTFYAALRKEYIQRHPELYKRKLQVLASIAFIQAPTVLPPAGGRPTVFHGLDKAAYGRLARIEDLVFARLLAQNGSLKGVRPFSVCETRYMIEKYVKDPASPLVTMPGFVFDGASWMKYQAGYAMFAAACPQADKDEWFNFRGLGKLRPSWLESNVMDRFLRNYNDDCRYSSNTSAACVAWRRDRLSLRNEKNKELGRRMFVYHPTQEAYLASVSQPLVLVPDQNGDGVGEIIMNGSTYKDANGMTLPVTITSTGEFTGSLNVPWKQINLTTQVDERYSAATDRGRADFGLLRIFPMGMAGDCAGGAPTTAGCPLLKRLYVTIDRHEYFYATYTSLYSGSMNLGKQPSPFVACSITLAAADKWAHSSPVGTDGFVFVMRIPFKDILAAAPTPVATLDPKPVVTTLADLYKGAAALDFDRLWFDVATLSSNFYAHEHEISKYGYVRAEQVEGIIYTGVPDPAVQ
jgi:hypothetical protein